jgi:hypothetical protein
VKSSQSKVRRLREQGETRRIRAALHLHLVVPSPACRLTRGCSDAHAHARAPLSRKPLGDQNV